MTTITEPTPLQLLPTADLQAVAAGLRAAFDVEDQDSAAGRHLSLLAAEAHNEVMARRGIPTSGRPSTAPTVDRQTLTTLLHQARQENAGAFLQALRGATRTLQLDADDDQLLVWLAGWDAEIVAGIIRLLRLAGSR